MKYLFSLIFLISFQNYSQNKVSSDDLKLLLGEWKGSLTYIDYKTNNPFTMPANLQVEKGKNDNQLSLNISYPKESNANSKEKIKVTKKGTQLNNRKIISRENLSDGSIQITTEYIGKDNNLSAVIRNIYIIGKSEFIISKKVKFDDSEEWLLRSEYKYKR